MQLEVFWAALRRRWYLVITACLLGVGATVLAVYMIGPTYKAQAAILLLPPGTSTQAGESSVGNPYLSLGGVSQARDVVIRSVMGSTTREDLCQAEGDAAYNTMRSSLCASDPTVSYLATPDFTSSAPMILITTESDSPEDTITALNAVADRVPAALHDLQSGLKLRDKALITSMPVVVDKVPEVAHKSQIRGGIVAGAGAVALGLLLIGLIDGLLLSRSRVRGRSVKGIENVDEAVPTEPDDVVEPADTGSRDDAVDADTSNLGDESGSDDASEAYAVREDVADEEVPESPVPLNEEDDDSAVGVDFTASSRS